MKSEQDWIYNILLKTIVGGAIGMVLGAILGFVLQKIH
jgi:hypothetical protein